MGQLSVRVKYSGHVGKKLVENGIYLIGSDLITITDQKSKPPA